MAEMRAWMGACVVLLTFSVGCGSTMTTADGGETRDATTEADAGTGGPTDAAPGDDAASAVDAGQTDDAGDPCPVGTAGCLCDVGASCDEGLRCGMDGYCCSYGTEGCLCDVGAACDVGLTCDTDGICVSAPSCEPIDGTPHADEASASALRMLDCGGSMSRPFVATLDGPETDWFTFFGNEAFGCPEQPTVTVTADVALAVCVYMQCVSGSPISNLVCAGGSSEATSPGERSGCCGDGAAGVEGYDCFGGVEGKDVNVYVSVASDAEVCADYGLGYSF